MTSKTRPRQPTMADVAVELQSGLAALLRDDTCTDFEVVVGKTSFRCHKVVLAAVSDYFKAMFSSEMKETLQNKATFQDMNPQTFQTILEILYPKSVTADPLATKTEDEISELLRVGEMLQMKILVELCLKYFQKTMSAVNCVERWKVGKMLLCNRLAAISWRYLTTHFSELADTEVLFTLDFDDFEAIIQDKGLDVKREEVVWSTVQRWVQYDENKRMQEVDKLLRQCCLTEIDTDFLIEKVAFDPFVRQSEISSQRVKVAYQYKRHPGVHGSVELKFRSWMGKEQAVFLLGKASAEKSQIDNSKMLLSGTEQQGNWIFLSPPTDLGEEFACCVHGTSIFVCGGLLPGGKKMFQYDQTDDRWEKRQQMIVPLRQHSMVASDLYLYALGGVSYTDPNSQIQQYCINTDSWELDGEIIAPVANASSVFFNDKIFIFGGNLQENTAADSVQVYDVQTKEATVLCHLPRPCSFSCALCWNGDIYVVTSTGDVLQFHVDKTSLESVVSIPEFERTNFGIDIKRDMLYIYGGLLNDADKSASKDVFAVDLLLKTVSKATKAATQLPCPLEVFGCGSVVVDTKG